MFKLTLTAKKMTIIIIAISLILIGLSLLFISTMFAYSIFYGTIVSILRLILLDRTITKSTTMFSTQAKSYVVRHYFLRQLITAISIFIAIANPMINISGAILGILLMNLSGYISPFIIKESDFNYNPEKIVTFDDDFNDKNISLKPRNKGFISVIKEMLKD